MMRAACYLAILSIALTLLSGIAADSATFYSPPPTAVLDTPTPTATSNKGDDDRRPTPQPMPIPYYVKWSVYIPLALSDGRRFTYLPLVLDYE